MRLLPGIKSGQRKITHGGDLCAHKMPLLPKSMAEALSNGRYDMTTNKRTVRQFWDDPLAFALELMKQHGEAAGWEAFLKFVADNDPLLLEQARGLAPRAIDVFRGGTVQ